MMTLRARKTEKTRKIVSEVKKGETINIDKFKP